MAPNALLLVDPTEIRNEFSHKMQYVSPVPCGRIPASVLLKIMLSHKSHDN